MVALDAHKQGETEPTIEIIEIIEKMKSKRVELNAGAQEEAKTHTNPVHHTVDMTKKPTDATKNQLLDVNIASKEARLTDAVEEVPNLKTLKM